ncbi:hypothetical protein FIBSPDRAFT_1018651, partial [Athelia psychrophila]
LCTLRANGAKFDSSHHRGDPLPLTLGIGQVIKGWDEDLQDMSDSTRSASITCPSDTATSAHVDSGVSSPLTRRWRTPSSSWSCRASVQTTT